MAKAIRVEERKEKMDLASCLAIGGEYEIKTGICRYNVVINGNGEEEYLKNKVKGD